tara:strand:+ start:188 stop:352 length:165 start_codon:yes stop_codon:yes gene_type:complete
MKGKRNHVFCLMAWNLLEELPDIDLLPTFHQKVVEEKKLILINNHFLRPCPEEV